MAFNSSVKRAIDITVPAIGCGYIAWYYIGKGKDRDIRYILFVMVLVGIALYAITSQITKVALKSALSGLKPADQEAVMKGSGIGADAYKRIELKAKAIYGAFHDSRFTEDEDLAIDSINAMTTPAEVKALCDIYNRLYGVSVKADFDEYVTFMDYAANSLKDIVSKNWY